MALVPIVKTVVRLVAKNPKLVAMIATAVMAKVGVGKAGAAKADTSKDAAKPKKPRNK